MTKTSNGFKFTDGDELIVSLAGMGGGSGTTGNDTPALTNVASSATSVAILAANASRTQASVFNDSSQVLYLKFGSGAASSTSFTVQIAPGGYYELPFPAYRGALSGIWPVANGNARITEVQ